MIQVLIAPIAVLAFGLAIGHGGNHHNGGNYHAGYGSDDGVVMFTHAGFRGEALVTDESIRDLRRFDFNDDISSMFIPDGFEVTFYGKRKFRGRSFTIEGPARVRRIDCSWNDRISSIEVVQTCGVPQWHGQRDDRTRTVDKPRKRRPSGRHVANNRGQKNKRGNR